MKQNKQTIAPPGTFPSFSSFSHSPSSCEKTPAKIEGLLGVLPPAPAPAPPSPRNIPLSLMVFLGERDRASEQRR